MATVSLNKNTQESIAWLSAFVFHAILLLLFFLYHLKTVTNIQQEEFAGVSVIFGNEDAGLNDETIGSEELINETESSTTTNTNAAKEISEPKIEAHESEEILKKSADVKKVEKKADTKTQTTKTNTTATTDTKKTNDEELNKKKSQFGNLFGKGSGNGGEQGNQGETKGDPNGKVLAGISTGTGKVGGGLSNRNIVQAPTVSENSQKYGKVVVKVCVDKKGKVIDATFTQKGSTTTDSQLVAISEKAAKKYVFAPGELDQQCGTVTFDFKLN